MAEDEKRVATEATDDVSRRPSASPTDKSEQPSEPFSYDEDDTFARRGDQPRTPTSIEHDLNVTEDDLLEAKELASQYTLEEVRDIMIRAEGRP